MFGYQEKVSGVRFTIVQYAVLCMFLLLAYGLWRLQVMESGKYAQLAEQNRVRNVPILAPRGKILDREGRIIVDNYPSFSALLLRDSTRDLNADADAISKGLHLNADEVRLRIKKSAWMPQYEPIYLKEDITPDELAFIEAHKNELPELETIMAHRRLYPRNGFMAHLIGYVGEVTEDMLNQPQFELYNPGDVVGVSGVEKQYNNILMGKNGFRRAIVNSHGREVGRLDETPAEPGKQLKLTIDLDLQIAAEEAIEGKNGAIIAMDPHTGEILAMVSRPTFDPNNFAVKISRDEWDKLKDDPDKPLLNKAIQAQLAPGSTFKVIMSFAGWQEGIAQTFHVNCNGGATFYGRHFACHLKSGHGAVNLDKAIFQSCDVFFYTLAEKLGIERIAKYATMLGLGQKTGIDLPNEVTGTMPSEEWKIRNFKQKWFAGETISVGIGQGAVTTTPVQLLRAISAVSMGGKMVVPHVINPTNLPPGFVEATHYTEVINLPFDPDGWNAITDAMEKVVEPGGTAGLSHLPGIDFAGKTGSAQTISNALKARLGASGKKFKDNGWFVGFEPRRNPDIVVCTLLEEGEHGYLAARATAKVVKAYVDKQRRQPTKMAAGAGKVEMSSLWTDPGGTNEDGTNANSNENRLQGGRFPIDVARKRSPLATAAPGLH
jgi:penicillin-binding protein 2